RRRRGAGARCSSVKRGPSERTVTQDHVRVQDGRFDQESVPFEIFYRVQNSAWSATMMGVNMVADGPMLGSAAPTRDNPSYHQRNGLGAGRCREAPGSRLGFERSERR